LNVDKYCSKLLGLVYSKKSHKIEGGIHIMIGLRPIETHGDCTACDKILLPSKLKARV